MFLEYNHHYTNVTAQQKNMDYGSLGFRWRCAIFPLKWNEGGKRQRFTVSGSTSSNVSVLRFRSFISFIITNIVTQIQTVNRRPHPLSVSQPYTEHQIFKCLAKKNKQINFQQHNRMVYVLIT